MRKLKPRGAIPRQSVGYLGEPAREGCVLTYTVSGRGYFPADMLRYDGAGMVPREYPRYVQEVTEFPVIASRVTPARWSSFGWSVHDDITERGIA